MGYRVSYSPTGSEVFTFANAAQVANYVKAHGLSRVAMGALSRDFPGSGPLSSFTQYDEQTQPYEFTTTFSASSESGVAPGGSMSDSGP
ncbi:MAG: hypothetical protein WDN30_09975 [Pararobbsia sp.]